LPSLQNRVGLASLLGQSRQPHGMATPPLRNRMLGHAKTAGAVFCLWHPRNNLPLWAVANYCASAERLAPPCPPV